MPTVSTGLARIDEMLGGGLPRGAIVELFGAPASGKTTLALNWVAAAQTAGLTSVWVDADRTLDLHWAAKAGVATEEMVTVRPESGPQAAHIVDELLRTFSVDLVVVDSAAALVPDGEIDASFEDLPLELSDNFLARMLRRSRALVERSRAILVFLNPQHMRDSGDVNGWTPGGRILTQYAAIRVAVRSRAVLLGRGGCSHSLSLIAIKNRFADPFQEAALDLQGAVAYPCGTRAQTLTG